MSPELTEQRPFYAFSDSDHSAVVVVAAVAPSLVMVASLVAKLAMCRTRRHKKKKDNTMASIRRNLLAELHAFDVFLFVGGGLMLVQTGCVTYAAHSGLGKHKDTLGLERLQYTSELLALVALACTKTSTCLLIGSVNPYGRMRLATRALLGLILVLFLLAGLPATAFRCPLPRPWLAASPAQCPSIGAVLVYNSAADALTDVLVVALAAAMVWRVQTSRRSKALIGALFGARLLCPLTTIPALATTHLYNTSDSTWLAVGPTAWRQLSWNLSVVTACVPSMKGLFDSFLGNTMVAGLGEMPCYRLEECASATASTPRNGDGNNVSSSFNEHATTKDNDDYNNNDDSNPRLTRKFPNEAACYYSYDDRWTAGRASTSLDLAGARGPGQGGSEENLTDAGVVVVRDEVEVHFDNKMPSSSLHSSCGTTVETGT